MESACKRNLGSKGTFEYIIVIFSIALESSGEFGGLEACSDSETAFGGVGFAGLCSGVEGERVVVVGSHIGVGYIGMEKVVI